MAKVFKFMTKVTSTCLRNSKTISQHPSHVRGTHPASYLATVLAPFPPPHRLDRPVSVVCGKNPLNDTNYTCTAIYSLQCNS